MNRIASGSVLTVFVASLFCARESQARSEPIVIADELRTAFYEHAPRALATEMSKAVVSWCSSDRGKPKVDVASWLCRGEKLTYFRSVYVSGGKGPHGLVCESSGISTLVFFGIDLVTEVVADGLCVAAEREYGSLYKLRVDKDGDDAT
jgi:hypothetical protein